MKMIHILLADDDKHIRELLHYHLQKRGLKFLRRKMEGSARRIREGKHSSCDCRHYDAVC